jgi:hypothetical protein
MYKLEWGLLRSLLRQVGPAGEVACRAAEHRFLSLVLDDNVNMSSMLGIRDAVLEQSRQRSKDPPRTFIEVMGASWYRAGDFEALEYVEDRYEQGLHAGHSEKKCSENSCGTSQSVLWRPRPPATPRCIPEPCLSPRRRMRRQPPLPGGAVW